MAAMINNPFLIAFILSLALTIFVDRFERWRLSRPGQYAAADFSGMILLAGLLAGLWAWLPLSPQLPTLLVASVAVFLVAAVTDMWRPSRGLRMAAAIIAGIYLCRSGLCISSLKLPFSPTLVELGWVGPALTVIWLALSSSLFARTATIPRVSTGVATLASATLYAVCLLQPEVTGEPARVLTLALTGCCLAMLLMPNYLTYGGATAGGYVLGFVFGAAAIMGALKHTAFLVALLPVMIIGVPLFAALYSWIADYVKGRNRPGRMVSGPSGRRRHPHIHEILMQQGYSTRQVSLILLTGTAVLCVLALLLVVLIELTFVLKIIITLLVVLPALAFLYVLLRLMKPANPPADLAPEINLLGIRVDRVTMEEAMQRVERFIGEDTPHMIFTGDATGLMKAQDDPELHKIINEADLVTADGAGVVLSSRLLNQPLNERVSGCDMVGEICKVAAKLGRSVYLLGAAPGVADKAAEKLQLMAPGLQIAGCRDGYFKADEEAALVAEIAALRPAALFVALGIPRQEKFIKQHMEALGVPVCIGIGGSFDVISGLKKRAPVWMQRTGLEWLYRVSKEPSRLPRLTALPRIVIMSFRELLRAPEQEES
jgi:N-acetylglucosaminyldiphosphoundecaprenol N-acetyl-beta-D-mannosaminyltransferase